MIGHTILHYRMVSPIEFARVYRGLGDLDRALGLYEQAVERALANGSS